MLHDRALAGLRMKALPNQKYRSLELRRSGQRIKKKTRKLDEMHHELNQSGQLRDTIKLKVSRVLLYNNNILYVLSAKDSIFSNLCLLFFSAIVSLILGTLSQNCAVNTSLFDFCFISDKAVVFGCSLVIFSRSDFGYIPLCFVFVCL